jgi:hypothetical protein
MNQSATSVRNHCLSPARARVAIDAPLGPASYARMFPELPSFQADEQFLHALGRAGGLCDCGDIEESADSLGDTAAGWPILGQFVAHDITADRSTLRSHATTADLHNSRSPQLNLECLYGDGPTGHPFLFQRDDPAKLLFGSDGADLQRNAEGIAIIGDPRNDSHLLVSQLHLAMLKAHNSFVDEVRLTGLANERVFDEAARQLRWHYQWLVLNEFLPVLVGQEVASQVLREGPWWFRPTHGGFIPLEFADAAYRYGHSQIRHRYQLNLQTDPVPLFPDLLGFRPVPRERTVDWTCSSTHPATRRRSSQRKSTGNWSATHRVASSVTGECEIEDYHSLRSTCNAARVLGSRLARPWHATSEASAQRRTGWHRTHGLDWETPLWYYILREADACTGVIVSVPLVAGSWRMYWLDSSMRM